MINPNDPNDPMAQLGLQAPGQYGGINPSAGAAPASSGLPPAGSGGAAPPGGNGAPAPTGGTGGTLPGTGTPGTSGQYGGINPGGGTPTSPTTAANGPDQAGINQFQSWAQTTFGRQATPQELQQIAQQIGYAGGQITPQMMQAAQQAAMQIAQGQGWRPPAPPPPPPPPPTGTGASNPNTLLEQRIREMLSQNPNNYDPNSAAANAQRNVFARANQRALEQQRRAAAERAASGGTLASGGFEATQQGIDSTAAQRSADFEGQLAARELQTQRDQTMQAMQMANAAGLQREAQQLQERLAQQDLALRRMLGVGQLGLGAQQLQQQGQQFNAQLGFNYWNQLQQLQRGELLGLLGGL